MKELNLLLNVIREECDSIDNYDINAVMNYDLEIVGFDILTPSDTVIRLCPFDRKLTVDNVEYYDRSAIAEIIEYFVSVAF